MKDTDSSSFLRRSLLANAAFSGLSGLVFIFGASPISHHLGLDDPIALVVVGVSLVFYALGLAHNARRPAVSLIETRVAIALDVLWVIGSAGLILTGLLSATANWVVAILADLVLVFAICQFIGLRRVERARPSGSTVRQA
jgi:hypothetical protein